MYSYFYCTVKTRFVVSFQEDKFEDTKEVIRNRKLKDIQYNGQKKKGQTTIYNK